MTLSGKPVADPYFAAVRRGTPDSTEAPARVVGDDVDEVVAAVLARVGFFTAELWSTLGAEQDPEITLCAADRDSAVRVEARMSESTLDSSAFGRLQSELEQRGWDVTPAAGSAPLEAHLGGGVVTASSYAGAGLELTVDSAPVPVGAERAAALVRDGVIA